MMITRFVKDGVLRLARVPAEPHVPEGARESVRVFNAGRNYLVWRLILWGIGNVAVGLGFAVAFGFTFISPLPPLVRMTLAVVEVCAVGVFLVAIPITYF